MPTKYASMQASANKSAVKKSTVKGSGVSATKKPAKLLKSGNATPTAPEAIQGAEHARMQQEAAESVQKLQWLQAKLSDQEKSIDELQLAYQQVQGEKQALERQLQQKNSQLNAQQQLLGSLQVELSELRLKEEENEALRAKNDFLEKQMDAFRRLQAQHKHLQDQNALQAEESARLAQEAAGLRERVTGLEAAVAAAKNGGKGEEKGDAPTDESLKRLEAENTKLKAIAGRLRAELQQTLNKFQQQREATERLRAQAKAKVDTLTKQLSAETAAKDAAKDELDVVRNAFHLQADELSRLKLHSTTDEVETQKLRDELLEVQNQLQAAQAALNRRTRQISDLAELATRQAARAALTDSTIGEHGSTPNLSGSGARLWEEENERLRARIAAMAKELDGSFFRQTQGVQAGVAALNKQLQEARLEVLRKDAQIQALDAELRRQTLQTHKALIAAAGARGGQEQIGAREAATSPGEAPGASEATIQVQANQQQNNSHYIQQITQLTAKVSGLEEQNRELLLKLQKHDFDAQQMSSKIDNAKKSEDQQNRQINELKAELQTHTMSEIDKQKQINDLEEQIQQLKDENDILKQQNANIGHNNESNGQQIQELYTQLKQQLHEIGELKQQIIEAHSATEEAERRAKLAEAALQAHGANKTTTGTFAPVDVLEDLTRDDLNGGTLRGLHPVNMGSNIKADQTSLPRGAQKPQNADRIDQLKTQIQYLHQQLKQKNAALEEQLTENDKLQQQLIKQVLEATGKPRNPLDDDNSPNDDQNLNQNMDKDGLDLISRLSTDHRHKMQKLQETYDVQLREQTEQHEQLKKKYLDLKQQLEAREQLLSSTDRNADEMQAQLMQYKSLTTQLANKLMQVKERVRETREQLNSKQTELGALHRDFIQVKAQLQERTRELEALRLQQTQDARHRDDLESLQERIKSFQLLVQEKDEKIKSLQQQLDAYERLSVRHQFDAQTLEQLTLERETARQHSERLAGQVAALHERLRALEEQKIGLEQQVSDLKVQNQGLQSQIQNSIEQQQQVSALQQQLTDQTSRLSKQERQLLDQQEQLNQLLDAKQSLQMQNNRLASLHIKQVSKKLQYAVLQDREQSVAQLAAAARFLQIQLSLGEAHTIVKNKFLVNKDLKELVLAHIEKMIQCDLPGPNPIASIAQNHSIAQNRSGNSYLDGMSAGPRLDLLLVHSEGLRVSILRSLAAVKQQIPDFPGFYAKVQAVATLLLTSYAFYAVVDPSHFSSPQDRFLRQLDYKKVLQDLQDANSCVYSVHVNDYVFLRALVQAGAEAVRRDFQRLRPALAAALMDGIDIARRCGLPEFQLETVQLARSGGLVTSRLFGAPGTGNASGTSVLSQNAFYAVDPSRNDSVSAQHSMQANLSDYSLGATPRLLGSPQRQGVVCTSPLQVPGHPGTVDAPGIADLASEAVCLAVLLNLCGVRFEPVAGCYYPRLVSVDGATIKEPGLHD